jgi:hypothetical protein
MNDLHEILKDSFDYNFDRYSFCKTGIITAVNSDNTVNVKPSILKANPDGSVQEQPIIYNVQVCGQRTASASVTLPIAKGDQCLLLFTDESLDNWQQSKSSEAINPEDSRTHDVSDCICIVGLWQNGKGDSVDYESLTIKNQNCKMVIKDNKVAIGTNTAELLQIVNDLMSVVSSITVTGAVGAYVVNASDPTTGVPAAIAGVVQPIITKLSLIKGSL